jgi:hypothetical protein
MSHCRDPFRDGARSRRSQEIPGIGPLKASATVASAAKTAWFVSIRKNKGFGGRERIEPPTRGFSGVPEGMPGAYQSTTCSVLPTPSQAHQSTLLAHPIWVRHNAGTGPTSVNRRADWTPTSTATHCIFSHDGTIFDQYSTRFHTQVNDCVICALDADPHALLGVGDSIPSPSDRPPSRRQRG